MKSTLALLLSVFLLAVMTVAVTAADKKDEKPAAKETTENSLDWLTFTAQMTGYLAWPTAFLIVMLCFREQVRQLLKRMTKFEALGVKSEYQEQLHDVEEKANEARLPNVPVATPSPLTTTTTTPAPASSDERLDLMIRSFPASAIQYAWQEVENGMRELSASQPDRGGPLSNLLHFYGDMLNAATAATAGA